MSENLNPEKALIFRIVHRDNVPWILDHGLHCRNSTTFDANYRNIGNLELIDRRNLRRVPIPPGGTLSDYVPFYFTPYSVMLYNIHTGRGVPIVPNEEIVILVSSLRRLSNFKVPFVFSDRHAYLKPAQFYNDSSCLDRIDWNILQRRDFNRDPDDPEKMERYQAEALAYQKVPVDALLGIVCYNGEVERGTREAMATRKLELRAEVLPRWYF